jgi:hypothetical protein
MNSARVYQRRALWMPLACLLAGMGMAAAQATPNYSDSCTSVCIPFVSDPNQQPPPHPFTDAPMLRIAVGDGKPTPVTMDTGSVGIAVPAGHIHPYQPTGQCGSEFLSSSNLLWLGHWVHQTVTFYDNHGDQVATACVPVLGVEQEWTCPELKAGKATISTTSRCQVTGCQSGPRKKNGLYMGVGFGRQGDFQPQGTPDKNALLNLATITINGQQAQVAHFNPGYIIGSAGITVGLTKTNTAGFNFIRLSSYKDCPPQTASGCPKVQYPEPSDWTAPSICVQTSGSSCPSDDGQGSDDSCCKAGGASGTLLVDTGIDYSFLTVPWTLSSECQLNPCNPKSPCNPKTGCQPNSCNPKNPNPCNPGTGCPNIVKMLPPDSSSVVVNVATHPEPQSVELIPQPTQGRQPSQPCYVSPNPPNTPAFVNTGRHFLRQYQFLYDAQHGYVGLQQQSNAQCPPPVTTCPIPVP